MLDQMIMLLAESALFAAQASEDREKQRELLTPIQYVEWFRSISIKLPRRSGHSTAAARLSDRLAGASLVVVPDFRHVHYMRTRLAGNKPAIFSVYDVIYTHRTRGLEPSIVIVDEASSIAKEHKHEMFACFERSDPFYIFLG